MRIGKIARKPVTKLRSGRCEEKTPGGTSADYDELEFDT
jgi:hypothetical protein